MNSLPVQMLPLKEKDKEWKIACMDALESIGRKQFLDNVEILENYRMVNNEILYNHYVYTVGGTTDLAQMATKEFDLPPYLRNYDIINKTIKVLSGEYQTKPDLFRIAAIDPFATNEFLRTKGEMLSNMVVGRIQGIVNQQLLSEGFDPNKQDFATEEEQQQYQEQLEAERQKLTPEEIETYMTEKYRSVPEKWGEMVLKLDKQRFNTPELEMIEFEDMLICDRAFRHFYLKANGLGYCQETWNPIRVFFHKSPDIKYVEDGDYVGRVFYLSLPEIINRYGHKMTKEQLEDLYGDFLREKKYGGAEYSFFQATNVPFENYPEYARTLQAFGFDPHTGIPYTGSLGQLTNQDVDVLFNSSSTSYNLAGLTLVTEAYWRSQAKRGFLIMKDPDTGEIIEEIVDETVELPDYVVEVDDDPSYEDLVYYPERRINTIRWTWLNVAYGGTKVNVASSDKDARALYIGVQELPFQFKGDTNPYEIKLPVCGAIFNNRNAKSMSLAAMAKPYQILYNVFMNKIFQLASTDMGKILALDPRTIPNDLDLGGTRGLQKWVTLTKETKIAQIDTSPGNRAGSGNQPAITMLDMRIFDEIKATVEIAAMIEQQFLLQVGITLQRLGQAETQQTATGVIQNLKGSVTQTTSWFTRFSNYLKRVKQMNLDIAQYCSATNRDLTLSLIQDDMSRQFMQINGTDLLNSQLGIYVFSSQELLRQTEMLKTLITTNNTTETPLSALAEVIYTESPARIIEVIKKGEAEVRKQIAAKNAHEEKLKQMDIEAENQRIAEEHAWKSQEAELDRESRLREKVISVTNFDKDIQENGQIDVVGVGNLEIDKQRLAHDKTVAERDSLNQTLADASKANTEKEKMKTEKELKQKEHELKKQEMKNRLQVEREKKDQIVTQNKSQEKIAKEKHASDLELKDKDIELKKLDILSKKKEVGSKGKELKYKEAGAKDDLTTRKKLNRIKIKKANKPPKKA